MSSWHFRKWKPSPVESLLIQSAFSEKNTAIASWKSWKKNIDWKTINKSSVDLFPLVYKNLSPLIDDELWPKFKGVHLKIWSWNNLLFEKITPALELLNNQQIPFLVLKGGALLYRYNNLGLRNSGDYDLLVQPKNFLKAINLLLQNTWKPENDNSLSEIKIKQEIHLCKENIFTIDLHQSACHLTKCSELEQSLWQYQQIFSFQERSLHRPADTEMLFIILAHGFRLDANRAAKTFHWIADSLLILEDSSTIDWDRFCFLSKKTYFSYILGFALSYLAKNNLTSAIPQRVIDNLTSGVPTKEERIVYVRSLHPRFHFYNKNPFRKVLTSYSLYLFFNGKINLLNKRQIIKNIFGLPQYLMKPYKASGYSALILIIFKKLNKHFFIPKKLFKSF